MKSKERGDFPIDLAVEAALRRHRGRGIVVLLSDFLTFGDLERPLNMLFSAGLEVFAVQILAPSELNPEVSGDIRLVDCESGHTVDVSSAGDLLGIYQEHRLALEEELGILCRQRSGRFLSISSRDPLEWVLFDLLRRKGGSAMSWWPFLANQWAWLFLLLVPLVIFYFLKLKRQSAARHSLAGQAMAQRAQRPAGQFALSTIQTQYSVAVADPAAVVPGIGGDAAVRPQRGRPRKLSAHFD